MNLLVICHVSFKGFKILMASAKTQEFSWGMMQAELMSVELSGIGVMLPLNLEVYVYVKIKLCAPHVTQCNLCNILRISSCTH